MAPRDSILILAYNKAEYTEACLLSLMQTAPIRFEVIVVDNGSNDRTPGLLESLQGRFEAAGSRLRIVRNDRNAGACVGRNQAMAAAEGESFVFLDNDCVVCEPGWLETLHEALGSEPDVALVGPKICYPFEPHRIQCAGVGISRSGRVQFRGRGEPADTPGFDLRCEVQALISACMLFPRALYEEIGGLDEAFSPVQFEDFDFCYRARAKGDRALYAPEARIHHWESVTSDGSPAIPNTYLIVKNGMRFKERWRRLFEKENGPPDEACRWRTIEAPSLKGKQRRVVGHDNRKAKA